MIASQAQHFAITMMTFVDAVNIFLVTPMSRSICGPCTLSKLCKLH